MNQNGKMTDEKPQRSWLYFSDRPVGLGHNVLWQTGDIALQQIEDIAHRLVAPLIDERLYPSGFSDAITFAVHGGWGSGKSSFLRMIKQRALELAGEEYEGRIKFCEYVASAYVNIDVDVRTTLAMRVLTVLAGNRERALQLFGMVTAAPEREDPYQKDLRKRKDLHELAEDLAQLVDFPDFLADELVGRPKRCRTGEEGIPRIMVVLIDDLDRCQVELVSAILDTTQQWGTVPNLFFILAIDQRVLIEAVKKRETKDPDYALEKYVQHIVTVPDLDDERLRDYVQSLLQDYHDEVSTAISENVVFLETGLRIKTPRAVKRCLNTIRPDIYAALAVRSEAAEETDLDPRKIIKERVLQYSWREFYNKFFVPAVKGQRHRRILEQAWRELESACAAYVIDEDEEKLDFLVARFQNLYREDMSLPLDRALARYLGQYPYWLYDVSEARPASGQRDLAASIPAKLEESAFDLEDVLEEPDRENVDITFMQLYTASRAARDRGDRQAALERTLEVYKVAQENIDQLPSHRADEIGNMALDAERFRSYDFADALFQLALTMKPDHPNNMQNYVSFIADTERKSRYDLAVELLDRLGTPQFASFKPEHRLQLQTQIAALTGIPLEFPQEIFDEIMSMVQKQPADLEVWVRAMMTADQLNDAKLMREVTLTTLQPADSVGYAYARIRALADGLARLPTEDIRKEAMEIFRRLLLKPERLDRDDLPDVQHNYSILLYRFDYDEDAGRLCYEAYKQKPQDTNIRNVYSEYLSRAGRSDLAEKVLQGEPLPEMVLQEQDKTLPAQFSDAKYIDEMFKMLEQLATT